MHCFGSKIDRIETVVDFSREVVVSSAEVDRLFEGSALTPPKESATLSIESGVLIDV
jgi:hypothetical protein